MYTLNVVVLALLVHLAWTHPMEEMLAKDAKENFSGKQWVVLAAGSNGWYNYRHQSDVLHAYKIVKDHGIPDSQIILMVYDDLAQNNRNPVKGSIINKHGGPNLYSNIEIDYKGNHVTAKNFLNALQGNAAAMKGIGTGQVVNSGPNDHIFVFIDDHGAPGFFCFPTGGYLYATTFNKALANMHTQNKYAEMVIYVEACESGSMFKNLLPNNIKIYGTTASNAVESSYACYYESSLGTYLGDLYSVNWMEDSDSHSLSQESLDQQFNTVKAKTASRSHVMKYGQTSMGSEHLDQYQGLGKSNENVNEAIKETPKRDSVDSREVPIMIEFNKLKDSKSQSEKEEIFVELHKLLEKRLALVEKVRKIFSHSVHRSNADPSAVLWDAKYELVNHECYMPIVDKFHDKCYELNTNDYALAYMHKFVTLCENGVNNAVVLDAIDQFCQEKGYETI